MGIQGLLPFLKKIHEPVNVSKFSGCTVAIDAYCWLHKGAFSCAEKLALGEKTDQYVYYCMKFLNYMLAQNVKPVMVFDGCHLPSKKLVEKTRREKRDSNRKKAAQFLREGRRAEARECLQRSIDISPEMALNLMNACRNRGVDCIVAPFEADAQLAYLNKIGVADVIITEDSDLLLFGCEKVLFKMDHGGNGLLIEQRRLNEVVEIPSESYTFEKFRYMCIMSGCDYLASLSGIGLARANKVFKVARQPDMQLLLKKLSTYLKSNITVPQNYIDGFVQADNTFLYQLVYDPLHRKLVPLTPYPPDISPGDLPYAGGYVQQERALQIALGNINIYTKELFADFDPDTFVPKYSKKKPDMLHMRSIWDRAYRVRPRQPLHETQPSDRPLLKGQEVTVRANLKRHSPKKRVREAEESRDVKTDTELYGMYNIASPMKKKPRTDEVVDELQRFMFAPAENAQAGNQSEDEEEEKAAETGPARSPQFFHSLSRAHPGVADLNTSQESESDKENGLKSPTRNIFASKSPAKKPRFDLNAKKPKKVLSRFFSNSVKKASPSEINADRNSCDKTSVKDSPEMSGYRLVHHCDTPETTAGSAPDTIADSNNKLTQSPHKTPGSRKPTSPFRFSKEKQTSSQNSDKASPSGSFKWSMFKFGSKSSANISSPLTSTKVNNTFKKVVSESTLDNFLKTQSQEKTEEKQGNGDNSGLMDNVIEEVVPLPLAPDCVLESKEGPPDSQSAGSYPYSIDSYCVDTNQSDSQRSDISSSYFINSQDSISESENSQRRKCSIYDFKNVRSDIHSSENKDKAEDIDEVTSDKGGKSVSCSGETRTEDPPFPEVVCLLDSDDENEAGTRSTSTQDKRKPATYRKPSAKGNTKPGCRVSGLSRKTSKKAAPAVDSRQQSLKDMFSKFAHANSGKPKLSHQESGSTMVIEDDPATPEGDTSLLHSRNTATQRKLLDAN